LLLGVGDGLGNRWRERRQQDRKAGDPAPTFSLATVRHVTTLLLDSWRTLQTASISAYWPITDSKRCTLLLMRYTGRLSGCGVRNTSMAPRSFVTAVDRAWPISPASGPAQRCCSSSSMRPEGAVTTNWLRLTCCGTLTASIST
jgi:hypothetical protein